MFLYFPELVCSLRWIKSKISQKYLLIFQSYIEFVLGYAYKKLLFNRQTKCHTGRHAHHLETEHLFCHQW